MDRWIDRDNEMDGIPDWIVMKWFPNVPNDFKLLSFQKSKMCVHFVQCPAFVNCLCGMGCAKEPLLRSVGNKRLF